MTFCNTIKEIETAKTFSFFIFIGVAVIGAFLFILSNSLKFIILGAIIYAVGLILFSLDQRYWDLKMYILHGTKGCKK